MEAAQPPQKGQGIFLHELIAAVVLLRLVVYPDNVEAGFLIALGAAAGLAEQVE
jgi:hypothetical protein